MFELIKRLIIYLVLCSLILVGGSVNSNTESDISKNNKKANYKISELADWRNITIKTGIYSNVGDGEIVENDNKVFYVNNGIEINIIYDIKLNREYKIQMPNDYFRTEFMIGDMILYNPLKSDCMKVVRIDVKQ